MIEGHFELGASALEKTALLRYETFTAELGMPSEVEIDIYDQFAHHLIVEDGSKVVGTGRLVYKEDKYLIGRIAIDKDSRGLKLGDLVVRMLLDRAFNIGAKEVSVYSMIPVQGFYERIGFKAKGEPFIDATIEHIEMTITKDMLSHGCHGCGGC